LMFFLVGIFLLSSEGRCKEFDVKRISSFAQQ
jgi:hypothetical protein